MRHFEEELEGLRRRLLEMSGLVESGIYHSVLCLVERDLGHAQLVLKNESRIDQMQVEIDEIATDLLAREHPVATDLRLITSVMKINYELERMADLAVNIAERAQSLMDQKLIRPPVDIPHLANLAESMARKAMDALVRNDADLARVVLKSDGEVDSLRNSIYAELIRFMESDATAIRQSIDLLFVARNLERIADHATNIAEDVLYVVEGVDVRHHAARRDQQ